MRVGEGGIRVYYGGVVSQQINVADVRASADRMWRRGLQILSEESTQYGAVAFGALRGQGHIHLRPAQCAIAVGSDVKRDRSGRAIRGWSERQLLLRGDLFIAGHLSLQVQGVEREAESDYRQHREHHQDAPGHGRTSGSLARTAAMPAAIDCAT